ncbi:Probable peroxygenase 4 [Linum perenne]
MEHGNVVFKEEELTIFNTCWEMTCILLSIMYVYIYICLLIYAYHHPPLPNLKHSFVAEEINNNMASASTTNDKQLSAVGKLEIEGKGDNVLQRHAMFFDRNKDGVIYPWETFQGLRAIGAGILLSAGGAVFINLGLSGKTRPGKFPSPLFPIEIKFVPEKFEEIFAKHAKTNRHALTSEELGEMLKSNREPKNYSGWLASYSEWKILFHLGKDKNGLLQKDTVRSVYDGSLFERMENEKHLLNKP